MDDDSEPIPIDDLGDFDDDDDEPIPIDDTHDWKAGRSVPGVQPSWASPRASSQGTRDSLIPQPV